MFTFKEMQGTKDWMFSIILERICKLINNNVIFIFQYIFEGLGHLIAKILISSSQYMDQIDEAGIQRMCRNVFALQQTLTNITMTRELALDHAKHYFELFFQTPEVSCLFNDYFKVLCCNLFYRITYSWAWKQWGTCIFENILRKTPKFFFQIFFDARWTRKKYVKIYKFHAAKTHVTYVCTPRWHIYLWFSNKVRF